MEDSCHKLEQLTQTSKEYALKYNGLLQRGEKKAIETNYCLGQQNLYLRNVILSCDLGCESDVCTTNCYLCTERRNEDVKIDQILRLRF